MQVLCGWRQIVATTDGAVRHAIEEAGTRRATIPEAQQPPSTASGGSAATGDFASFSSPPRPTPLLPPVF